MKHLFLKQTLFAFTLPWRLGRNYTTTTTTTNSRGASTAMMAAETEAITVENYEALLPPFDPNGNGLFGLVDMGRHATPPPHLTV